MKLDFNGALIGLDGNVIKNERGEEMFRNKVLANNLVTCTTFNDIVKLMEWGRKVYNEGILEVDKSDAITLRRIIMEFRNMFPIVKEQLLQVIDDAEKR